MLVTEKTSAAATLRLLKDPSASPDSVSNAIEELGKASENVSQEEIDNLLAGLLGMQIAFARAFPDNREFMTAHTWNVCIKFWELRNREKPIEKIREAIEWRRQGNIIHMGETKATEHLNAMIKAGLVTQYGDDSTGRVQYVKGTEKLFELLRSTYAVGVQLMRQAFANRAVVRRTEEPVS